MSRSYRKQPVCKDHNRGMKQIANRKVRRALNRDLDLVLQHRSYRKYFCSYDICDYCSLIDRDFERYYQNELNYWGKYTLNGVWYFLNHPIPTRQEIYREWIARYRGK